MSVNDDDDDAAGGAWGGKVEKGQGREKMLRGRGGGGSALLACQLKGKFDIR